MSSAEFKSITLFGRINLDFEIFTLSGLHIGGAPGTLSIGNVDNPVIRNPFTNEPYIPGSSLRGKMRSQLEKVLGAKLHKLGANAERPEAGDDKVWIHTALDEKEYANSPVARIFGVTSNGAIADAPTRLIVRDALLSEATKKAYSAVRTDLPYTEVKWEAAIDRITSAAVPRQQERVPAGAMFKGALTFSLYHHSLSNDVMLFDTVLDSLQLVEDDYLGGQGARGSGQVQFRQFTLTFKLTDQAQQSPENKDLSDLSALRAVWNTIKATLH